MLAVLPKVQLKKQQVRRRIKKLPDSYMGHGFFKILPDDLIYRVDRRFTYVIQQITYDNWRIFVFNKDFLVHTSRYATIQMANRTADDYIWSYVQ